MVNKTFYKIFYNEIKLIFIKKKLPSYVANMPLNKTAIEMRM